MNAIASKLAAIALVAAATQMPAQAVDSVSLELGNGNKTDLVRAGAQWNWNNRWWQSNGTHIGGYWDLNAGHWRGDRHLNIPGNRQSISTIGVTPVFRFQNDRLQGLYGEFGIGANWLSGYYDNNGRQFSTRFQFSDHIGVGYVFANKLDVSFRFQHFSNASIKQPNDGANFSILRVSYPLF
ncbi:acyloxyacyl hydrolase [Janthinobacterium sp. 17J80-10]|uniref:acyloxyacyl hydrolase n=1 Tax=Janthinobacterium sp. 17J80-10 TaxID=2497863 RepID=UPI001F512F6D|nr:acyloxyacyl hydrolase [Janthinobacterium sp. 17J80-10]